MGYLTKPLVIVGVVVVVLLSGMSLYSLGLHAYRDHYSLHVLIGDFNKRMKEVKPKPVETPTPIPEK